MIPKEMKYNLHYGKVRGDKFMVNAYKYFNIKSFDYSHSNP